MSPSNRNFICLLVVLVVLAVLGVRVWNLEEAVNAGTESTAKVHQAYTKILTDHSVLLTQIEQAFPTIWTMLNSDRCKIDRIENKSAEECR